MKDRIEPIFIKPLFKSKNPGLARWIPSFVFSWLERVIHQGEINEFISAYGDRKGLDFARAILEYLRVDFRVEGEENLPDPGGRYIFASNHPLGGPDGIILIAFLGERYPNLKFPVNDLLMNLKNLNDIFLPVNKHGGQAKEAAAGIENAFASDAQVITFPAGMVSREYRGEIKDPEWQKSFIAKAIKHRRDIVPVRVSGTNSPLFYRVFRFRQFFRIKLNLEMMLLPRETFKKKGSTFTLKVGRPIPWQSLDKSKTMKEWAREIQEQVHRM
ncbi:MAG: 1-acyl-sn-glycerol-3-phosphate acyltransferase [Odoribacteraceae bacterium]|jgi:putative hemolysin|nr:1-acyl-sn-glycerol-3-phosphate acyltransferase [Odoribacteraceae bacterium]